MNIRFVFGVVTALCVVGASAQVDVCIGKIPDYVTSGNAAMRSTEVAERLACRDDAEFHALQVARIGGITLVENATVPASSVRSILETGERVEFRACRFPEAIDLSGNIPTSMTFRSCEFEGSLSVRYATFAAGLVFTDCLFHQELTLQQTKVSEAVTITGCVATSTVTLENVTLQNGLHVSGTRFLRGFISKDVRSPAGLVFDESRWLGRMTSTDLDLQGGIRFHDCAWDRADVIEFVRGSIAGGIRFDGCSFDGRWNASTDDEPSHVKLTDISLGSAFVIADAGSSRFPLLRISRSVIPFIKLPEWSVAKQMVQQRMGPGTEMREIEDSAELLQLLRIGYEREGRTRDADVVRSEYELTIARIRGGPAKYLRIVASHFGTGALWAVAVVLTFSAIVFVNGVVSHHSKEDVQGGVGALIVDALYMSTVTFVHGPPIAPGREWSTMMIWLLRCERVLGMAFFFILGLAVNDWLHV